MMYQTMRKREGGDIMIEKRYLIVLTVALVSVLLGSLLYSSLALAGKPQPQPSICKDAIEITVLDWTDRYYQSGSSESSEMGLTWFRGPTVVDLPFVFIPKEILLNVTRLWITLVVNSIYGDGLTNIKAKINNNFAVNFGSIWVDDIYLSSHTRYLEHDPVLNAISSGINLLQLYDLSDYDLLIYRITMFIEYKYQAR